MTVEEKRRYVGSYCKAHDCNNSCVLFNTFIGKDVMCCLCIGTASEGELDKAIDYIEGRISRVSEIEPANDPVNRPSHYTDGKIEVIEFIEDKNLGFCLGNAVKYIARAGKKDPTAEAIDIRKAIWYLKRYLKELGYEE